MGGAILESKIFNVNEHLINLKGKDYLPVAWRLVWFRQDRPNWNIETCLVEHDKESFLALFQCKIYDDNGRQVSSGYGSETIRDFKDYVEKAETKAVGRALAMLGYGTQFAPELDEGDRVVDTPQAPPKPKHVACERCGKAAPRNEIVESYRKTKKKLCNSCYTTYLISSAAKINIA